jgi:hypothetical protein
MEEDEHGAAACSALCPGRHDKLSLISLTTCYLNTVPTNTHQKDTTHSLASSHLHSDIVRSRRSSLMSTPSDNHPKMQETITSAALYFLAHPGPLALYRGAGLHLNNQNMRPPCPTAGIPVAHRRRARPWPYPSSSQTHGRPPRETSSHGKRLSLATVTTGRDPDSALPCLRLMMPSKPHSLAHSHTRHPVNSPRRGHETREPPFPTPPALGAPGVCFLVYRCPAVRPSRNFLSCSLIALSTTKQRAPSRSFPASPFPLLPSTFT